jgi:uncharacterized membrane protein YhaH (DUF805 family)
MRGLLRFWFTFEKPVGPRAYFTHGFALALLKYAVDAALIATFLGVLWTPLDYLATGASLSSSKLANAPTILLIILALWTLPFFWIGEAMSVRRTMDAGLTPWVALLFFVPLLSYAFMLAMSVWPSASARPAPARRTRESPSSTDRVVAILAGLAIGLGMMAFSVLGMRRYGIALFLGTPFLIGAVSAFLFNRHAVTTMGQTRRVVLLSLLASGGALVFASAEGLVCIAMAFPLALGIALLGAMVGRAIALGGDYPTSHALFGVLLLPASAPLLDSASRSPLREVRSAVEIDAPVDVVWRRVIAFPALPEPTDLVFRSGIAYPRGARIEGEGVGAIRYCEFSTGAFVEPITDWIPGKRLAFDVTASPPPLRELSPYGRVIAPHLDGFFLARRGEFRLVALAGGRTRLEGSTWYELRLQPHLYWAILSDRLVGRIHDRVLQHVRDVSAHDVQRNLRVTSPPHQ